MSALTPDVLRKAGFLPSYGTMWYQACGTYQMDAMPNVDWSCVWVGIATEQGTWCCKTPDRLDEVVRCLRGLYGPKDPTRYPIRATTITDDVPEN